MSRTLTRLQSLASTFSPTSSGLSSSQAAIITPIKSVSNLSRPSSHQPMEASSSPVAGLYSPNQLQGLYYGPNVVEKHLLDCLPSSRSKAFIITGSSLANKTPLITMLERLLTPQHHAGTFSNIKQHAPVAQLDEATELVKKDQSIDTIISVGGGSPIDSAKAISYRLNEQGGSFLRHIAIPTTLSAAECASNAGYTRADGVKTGVAHPSLLASYLFYDPKFGVHTPPELWMSTGIRALDHAVELQYHPMATWMPCRMMALAAVSELFQLLPKYKAAPQNEDVITRLFLAAYASLGFLGRNLKPGTGLGLSHTLGYALGSPYGIPHGITSCLTLGSVVKLKARGDPHAASALAAILPYIPGKAHKRTGDDVKDAEEVGDAILNLVTDLGLKTTLTEKSVGQDQIDTIVQRAIGRLAAKKAEEQTEEEKNVIVQIRKLVEDLY